MSIFTVGLNGLGYAFDNENSVGNTSFSTSRVMDWSPPQKPALKATLSDSSFWKNVWPNVPFKASVWTKPDDIVGCMIFEFWARIIDKK